MVGSYGCQPMKPVERGPHPTSTMLSPLRQFISIALTMGAVMFAFAGLRSLILPGAWLELGFTYLIIVAVCTFVARVTLGFLTRGEPHLLLSMIPTAVASVVGLWLIAGRFGSASTSFEPRISMAHLEHLRTHLFSVQTLTVEHVAPIKAYEPIVFIAVGGAILVFLLGDLLGNGIRTPALVGITILPLWLPHLMLVPDIGIVETLGTCLCLLALIAVDDPFRASNRRAGSGHDRFNSEPWQWLRLRIPPVSRTVGAVATVTVVALLTVWAVPNLSAWNRVSPQSALSQGSSIRVSDILDLSKSLQTRTNDIAFSYTVDGDNQDLGPLRTMTLTDFNDGVWSPSEPAHRAQEVPGDDPLWPFAATELVPSGSVTITIDGFSDVSLPIPTEPRSLTGGTASRYDLARDVLQRDESTAAGDVFTFQTHTRALTPEQLRNPQDGPLLRLPGWYPELVLRPALAIPESSHINQTRELAERIAENSPTAYDTALALQEFLRDPDAFTYSLELPEPRTDDSIWDFLTDRTGYCVQFASTMTIMARTLGLPARVGVGFLPGERTGDDQFTVRGKNAHAWTEIFFDNVGWVRFDPTPAVQSGLAPDWAPDPSDPISDPTSEPTVELTTSAPPLEPTEPEPAPTLSEPAESPSSEPGSSETDENGSPFGTLVVWFVLAVALITAVVVPLFIKRRKRLAGLEGAWEQVLRRSRGLGVEIDDSATLRQIADKLEPGIDAGNFNGAPIHELAGRLERARYAPEGARDSTMGTADQDRIDQLMRLIMADLTARFSGPRPDDDPSDPQSDA